jgi:hypothetical protein
MLKLLKMLNKQFNNVSHNLSHLSQAKLAKNVKSIKEKLSMVKTFLPPLMYLDSNSMDICSNSTSKGIDRWPKHKKDRKKWAKMAYKEMRMTTTNKIKNQNNLDSPYSFLSSIKKTDSL